jgi:serine/threonine protein kinase
MSARTPDYQPGQLVPGTVYKVHRVLGAGGMGTVYDVEDTTVGRRYVLKTLHGDLADRADLAARLSREARALAKLQHPNIVEVFTSGTTADLLRLPYYVMERLQGQSLRVALERRGHLTLEQSYDIEIDLLDALDHAHEAGIVHRDVKPDNIFLTRGRDGRALAKLLDFGIIKLTGGSTLHTGGRFIGTFRYAPPEQILGKEVTAQSDLYSAALVLYEMIAGRGPFDDFTGEVEIGKAHIDVPPPSITRFAQVPRELEALLASALAKRPEQRPASAYAFATALRELKRQLVGQIARANDVSTAAPVVSTIPNTEKRATELVSEREVLPGSHGVQGSTLPDTPQARVGPTVAVGAGQTVIMGPPPGMAPPSPTMTSAPATPPMAPAPAAPVVDRNAETRPAQPFPVAAPSHDTALIGAPAAAPAPKPPLESTAPALGREGPRGGGGGMVWALALGGGLALILVLAVGGFVARRSFADKQPPPTTATTNVATSVIVPVVTPSVTTLASPSAAPSVDAGAIGTPKPSASALPVVTATAKPSATARASATGPATATGPAGSGPRRPGSGL